jgi:hypothetical protein
MAGKHNIKRYWLIMLLALAMAETAHAPHMGKALGSTNPDHSGELTANDPHPKNDENKKSSSDIFLPPNLASVDPQKVKKKLDELEHEKPVEPVVPVLPWSPIVSITDGGGATVPDDQQPVDLTPGTGFTPPASDGGDSQFDPIPGIHLIQIGGGGDGGIDLGPTPGTPSDNPSPFKTNDVSPVSSIPEPGSMVLIVTLLSLLMRPTPQTRNVTLCR